MLVCPKCKGPMAPLFVSYYCKRECDSHSVTTTASYKRWDNQECLHITDPSQLPETWREQIWIKPASATTRHPGTLFTALGRQYYAETQHGGWQRTKDGGHIAEAKKSTYYKSGWTLLILP